MSKKGSRILPATPTKKKVNFSHIITRLTLQNLVEEVKLMQHALQKYKMEFKALEIRSRNVYKENLQHLTEEERSEYNLI